MRQRLRSGAARKALLIAGEILLAAAGIITLLIGAVVIAQQSSLAARAFDRIEISLRRSIKQSFYAPRRMDKIATSALLRQ
jgi:hypothetical protein